MGSIYAQAEFTIIAAAGHDSNAGLPGMNVARKPTQREVTVLRAGTEQPPITLITSLSTHLHLQSHILDATIWASRGLTQQERALLVELSCSRRNRSIGPVKKYLLQRIYIATTLEYS